MPRGLRKGAEARDLPLLLVGTGGGVRVWGLGFRVSGLGFGV